MNRYELLTHIRESLASISTPRFFQTERGYQGALLAQLNNRIPKHVLPKGAIVEQEYQKSLARHGLRIRPDIIIHEPFDQSRHADRAEGNIAVIELKLSASQAEACDDFKSLAAMIDLLHYPVGIFVNIGASQTHAGFVQPEMKDRIVSFAVVLNNGHVQVTQSGT